MKMKSNKKCLGLFSLILGTFMIFMLPVYAQQNKTVTFDSNGGNKIESVTFNCGQALSNLPTPSKDNYTFENWLDSHGNAVQDGFVPDCIDISLKAKWKVTCDKKCQACEKFKKDELPKFASVYGLGVTYDSDLTANPAKKTFTVSMSGSDSWFGYDSNHASRKFYISKIEYVNMNASDLKDAGVRASFTGDEIVTKFGIPKTARVSTQSSISFTNPERTMTRFKIYLKPDGFVDVQLKKYCDNDTSFQVQLTYDYYGDETFHATTPPTLVEPSINSTGIIDCSRVSVPDNPTTFEQIYCRDIKRAQAAGVQYTNFDGAAYYNAIRNAEQQNLSTAGITYFSVSGYNTKLFKCDPFTSLTNTASPAAPPKNPEDEGTNDHPYYENRSYLLGTMSFNNVVGQYVYNYGGQNSQTGQSLDSKNVKKKDISCKVTCNEVVTVEYPAPVASKAGLCFEYRVKVTSRVNCHSELPNKPDVGQGYCTPSPGCDHGQGYVDHAAGPSEDFDACVEKCDGGKYSTKCSVKCYNQVYKSGAAALSKTNSYNFSDFIATPLDYGNDTIDRDTTDTTCQGMYYKKDNVIYWKPQNHFGRWYCEHNARTSHACLKTTAQGGGISAVCGCSARCRWNGCQGNHYLNPGEAEKDDAKNAELYQAAIKTCESYSKCNTNQAEFSVSVDYTTNDNGSQKIYFPYTHNSESVKDTIKYNPGEKSVACTIQNTNTTLFSSNGCYKCANGNSSNDSNGSSNNWYQTVWRFPATWIHNKTGEISYEPKTGSAWEKLTGKFCLPADSGNVNQRWWNAYYIAKYGEDPRYSVNNTNSNSKCQISNCKKYTGKTGDSSFTEAAASELKYNINAKAERFGMFGWNINVSCFYATNDSFPTYEGGETCQTNGQCIQERVARVRSVDLNNLFPNENGEVLTSPNTVGRSEVPFNWSSYASSTKDENYISQPSAYTTWVQSTGYRVYEGDDYLDYEVNLSKDAIRELRNTIKANGDNYSKTQSLTGTAKLGTSAYYYRSSLFRGSNALLARDSKYPNENVLKCNNIRNYRATECENVHGDGE